ncbi:MAG: hypothetical protein KQH79_17460 [Bacteroidetes bacterium]|nr:hypothetical protein [Bacteroidota bacterium]
MPFKPNDKKINRRGRPKGSKNKVNKELKAIIKDFLESNWKNIEKDFKELSPRDKMKFYTDLMPYVVPKLSNQKNELDTSNLTPDQLEIIANKIINEINYENQ